MDNTKWDDFLETQCISQPLRTRTEARAPAVRVRSLPCLIWKLGAAIFRAFPVHFDQSLMDDWRVLGAGRQHRDRPAVTNVRRRSARHPLRSGPSVRWYFSVCAPRSRTTVQPASTDLAAESFLNARRQINHRIKPPRDVQAKIFYRWQSRWKMLIKYRNINQYWMRFSRCCCCCHLKDTRDAGAGFFTPFIAQKNTLLPRKSPNYQLLWMRRRGAKRTG